MTLSRTIIVSALVMATSCSQQGALPTSAAWAPRSAGSRSAWQPSGVAVTYGRLPSAATESSCDVGLDFWKDGSDILEASIDSALTSQDRCLIQVRPRGFWFENLVAILDLVRLGDRWVMKGVGVWHTSDVVVLGPDGLQRARWCRPLEGEICIDDSDWARGSIRCRFELRVKGESRTDSCTASFETAPQSIGAPLPWLAERYSEDERDGG